MFSENLSCLASMLWLDLFLADAWVLMFLRKQNEHINSISGAKLTNKMYTKQGNELSVFH